MGAIEIIDITDIVVPIYSLIVLLFIIAYQKSPETKCEDRYFLKKVVKSTEKKDWREVLSGFYHQCESDGFDDWLKFAGKPYPIRLVAPVVFHKLYFDMKLTATEFTFERFKSTAKETVADAVTITLGSSEENAPTLHVPNGGPDDAGNWKAWVEEGEEKVHAHFTPSSTANSFERLKFTREVIDSDTVLTSWWGRDRKGEECRMTSTYRRV